MFIKCLFGDHQRGFAIFHAEGLTVDCPNERGGIGDIRGKLADSLWTGDIHLWMDEVGIHFADIVCVETRSTLNEDDEPWKTQWEDEVFEFTYEKYFQVAEIIRQIVREHSERGLRAAGRQG